MGQWTEYADKHGYVKCFVSTDMVSSDFAIEVSINENQSVVIGVTRKQAVEIIRQLDALLDPPTYAS